jgi:hypothetical protein
MGFLLVLSIPGLFLFAIPCLLSRRWLAAFAALAAIGFSLLWRNHVVHRGEGNGVAEAFGTWMLLSMTAGVIGGIVARTAMLTLRRWRIRWRYAWLPAPIILALLIATPFAMEWYRDWKWRPPSDACLTTTHPITLAGRNVQIPMAPVFTLFFGHSADRIHNLRYPQSAREFCAQTTATPLDVRLMWLNFERDTPRRGWSWNPVLCASLGGRPWLHAFCAGPVDLRAAHYPDRLDFQSVEDVQRDAAYRDLAGQLRSGTLTDTSKLHWLHTPEGPLLVSCKQTATSCSALFEPRPGLAVGFWFRAAPGETDREAAAIHARAIEIVDDLFGE